MASHGRGVVSCCHQEGVLLTPRVRARPEGVFNALAIEAPSDIAHLHQSVVEGRRVHPGRSYL